MNQEKALRLYIDCSLYFNAAVSDKEPIKLLKEWSKLTNKSENKMVEKVDFIEISNPNFGRPVLRGSCKEDYCKLVEKIRKDVKNKIINNFTHIKEENFAQTIGYWLENQFAKRMDKKYE